MTIIEKTKQMICENAGKQSSNWDTYDYEADILNCEFVCLNSDAFGKIILMFDQVVTHPREINYEGFSYKKILTIAVDRQKEINDDSLCTSLVVPFLVREIFSAIDLNRIQLIRRDLAYFLIRGEEEANLTHYICERFAAFDKEALLEFVVENKPPVDLLAILNDDVEE
jgi:hypothetical protein